MPQSAWYSGGMERTLKLIEHSPETRISYTIYRGRVRHVVPGAERVLTQLANNGIVRTVDLDKKVNRVSPAKFEAVVIPTEYWFEPFRVLRSAAIRGPLCVECHELPYVGTVDSARIASDRELPLTNSAMAILATKRIHDDGIALSAFRVVSGQISVRRLSRLPNRRVMAITEVTKRNLLRFGFRDYLYVPRHANGVEKVLVDRARKQARDGMYDGLFVGRLHPAKGFLDLPLVVARMKRALGPKMTVAACGPTTSTKYLEKFHRRTAALDVNRNIALMGWLSKEDLYYMMRRSKVLLYPSYTDAFSITVLESLCLELPVAAYATDAMKMNWSGLNGVHLRTPGDSSGLGDIATRVVSSDWIDGDGKAMARQSNSLVDRHTWEAVVRDERAFYEWSGSGDHE